MTQGEFQTSFVAGLVINSFMQFLKKFDWYGKFVTAFPMADKWVHRAFAAVWTAVATVGIVVSFTGDASTGWTVQATVPSVNAMANALMTFVTTFTVQQYAYQSTRRDNNALPPHA